jgi:hypothetical protein
MNIFFELKLIFINIQLKHDKNYLQFLLIPQK